jgi:hypothetical protein
MNIVNIILYSLFTAGIIISCTSIAYLPPLGGTVPNGMSSDEFKNEQTQAVLNSAAFKACMSGIGISVIAVSYLIIKLIWFPIVDVVPIHPSAEDVSIKENIEFNLPSSP